MPERRNPLTQRRMSCDNDGMTVRKGERCAVIGEPVWGECVWSNPIKRTVCIGYSDGSTVIVRSDDVVFEPSH